MEDPLTLHPKAERLPLAFTRAMAVLPDDSLLTLDEADACRSRDNGRTWERRPMFPGSARRPSWEYTLLRCRGGALVAVYMDTATLRWAWNNETHAPAPGARLEVWSTRSLDDGATWSEPVRLFDGYCGAMIGMIQTAAGRLVVPVQRLLYDPGRHAQATYASDDEGLSWQPSNLVDLGGRGHHDGGFEGCPVELRDGRLWMLIRTNLDRFWEAFSEDGGLSWRTIRPTAIDASSAPAYVTRLASGRLMMAWNRLYPEGLSPREQAQWERAGGDGNVCAPRASWHRRQLSIAFSDDDGAHWTPPTVLVAGKHVSYPYILERRPGWVWVLTRFGQRAAVALHEADFCG